MTLKWKRANKKQKQQTNGNKAIWLVYRTDTNAPGFWLVKRTLGWKKFMPEELSRNRFDVILQQDWPIEQCPLHIRVFFGGKTKSPCLVLFIHWLIKQITNTYSLLPKPFFKALTKIALLFIKTSTHNPLSTTKPPLVLYLWCAEHRNLHPALKRIKAEISSIPGVYFTWRMNWCTKTG